tara:strand:- start:360 stop:803 length:444 start_codon:yes stop_codon:yes gene_type:complete
MSYTEQVKKDMYAAMKASDKVKTNILRTLLSSLKKKEIEKKDNISEDEYFAIVKRTVKQLKESANAYQEAGRLDLAEKEILELEIVKKYLPEILSEEETYDLVKKIITEISASDISEMGKVMSLIMQRSNGKVDGGIANRLVKDLLK